ncbi:hypothetical protein V8E54_001825, partial [Elaphomyces granulatus]
RAMLLLMYAISFPCLLRSDEVLRIEMRHIHREKINGRWIVELRLDFRKTHQAGDIKPFYFFPNRHEPWLDVCSLLEN